MRGAGALGSDGRTLVVYFWGGAPECTGLADVQVKQSDGPPSVIVWTGDIPGATGCPDVAQLYRVVVVLDGPLIRGGGLLDLPSGRVPVT